MVFNLYLLLTLLLITNFVLLLHYLIYIYSYFIINLFLISTVFLRYSQGVTSQESWVNNETIKQCEIGG